MSFPKTAQTNAKATAATLAAATLVVASTRIALLVVALRYVNNSFIIFSKCTSFSTFIPTKKEMN
jgi:hypothetical protein